MVELYNRNNFISQVLARNNQARANMGIIPFVKRGVYGMTSRGAIVHRSSRTKKWGRLTLEKKARIRQSTLDALQLLFENKKDRACFPKRRREKVEVSPNSLPWKEYLQWCKDYERGYEQKLYKWVYY